MEGPTEKCLGKLGSLIKYHNIIVIIITTFLFLSVNILKS